MKKSVSIVLLTAFLAVPQSCENSYSIYSGRYRVNYMFNPNIPPYNAVTSVGTFVSVRCVGTELVVTDAGKKTTRWPMSEAELRSFCFGLGGLIIGTPSLDNDHGQVFAYDLACPICDKASARLGFGSTGVAECPSCHSKFDLNNNGFVISAGDKVEPRPLYRYPVSQGGQTITIAN
ncbi:MAG: hypothetical protein MJY77_06235 [Bacteroidaceae bacterium]|nr:hypothetical protein [Bacteroidaceae bacterium]